MEKSNNFKILRVLSLLPILLWPLVFFGTVFFFDDPNSNPILVYMAFFGVNAYPLYLIGNVVLSNKLYQNNQKLAYALLVWPVLLFGTFIGFIVLN